MNTRKYSRLSIFSILGLALLFQYQNCAPVPGAMTAGAESSNMNQEYHGSPVHVIDAIDEGKLAFVSTKPIEVSDRGGWIAVGGICDDAQSGATLRWIVRDDAGAELGDGFVTCDAGRFTVNLSEGDFDCGSYQLSAQLGVEESDPVEVKRDCSR